LIAKHIKFLLICFVTLFSINAHSLQLGKIIFKSNQNSPLDVSIQVNLSSEDKIDQLKPSIAPKENYDSQGIERTKIHNDIVLSLTSQKKNKATLRLTSKNPVTEPFLDLLIQIESPSGKILKEYTLLLDPPSSVTPRKKIQEKKVEKKEISLKVKSKPEKIKKVETKKIVQKKSKIKTSEKRKTVTAIPGKTLFQIARENSIAGITTEQIVISIYQTNPNSFDSNLNGLIKGKKLKLPLRDYYKKLSHLEARKILKRENVAWKNIARPQKPKIAENVIKQKKKLDELSRLKKELETANRKLLEKEQELKAMAKINKPTVKPKEVEINASEIVLGTIKEIKDEVAEPIIKNESNAFISSITDQNKNIIEEVIIDDEVDNSSIKTVFVLLLLFLLTLLLGLLFIVRKKKKEINHDPVSTWSSDDETKESVVSDVAIEKNSLHDDSSQENPVSQTENVTFRSNTIEDIFNDPFTPDNNKDNDPR